MREAAKRRSRSGIYGHRQKMLKYQVRGRSEHCLLTSSPGTSPGGFLTPSTSVSSHDLTLTSRSGSVMSLNSLDSCNSENDPGFLRVYTANIKQCTDYKTIRVSAAATAEAVVDALLSKLKLASRDPNLFQLWMEVSTRLDGAPVRTVLVLSRQCRPLELQKCHPVDMSRFVLHMRSNGFLVRIHDHNICPQKLLGYNMKRLTHFYQLPGLEDMTHRTSNYKSILLAPETNCEEAIGLLLGLNRLPPHAGNYNLFLTDSENEAQIPNEVALVPIARRCQAHHKIVVRPIDHL